MSKNTKRRMSQKRFWEILSKTKGWNFENGCDIRKRSKSGKLICPVCAVANHVSKSSKYGLNQYEAGKYLGLNWRFTDAVQCAADDSTFGYEAAIKNRKRLIKVCKPKGVCS